jgi:type I restriction enzyme S subunit
MNLIWLALLSLKLFWVVNKMAEEYENVPEIRFAGFADPWEQRKFSEEFTFLRNNTLSRAELSSEKGFAYDVHYGDVLIKFGSIIDPKIDRLPLIYEHDVCTKLSCDALKNGDVVIADTAEDESAGKCSELRNLGSEIIYAGLHTMPCRTQREYASGFLGHYLNSPSYHNQLFPLMQGIKVISISKAAISETTLLAPSVAEQQMISNTLDCLDNLITLHQRKYEKLCAVKNSMLEKMFPKEGETVPEIRFAGFTDPWEQRKLGDITSYGSSSLTAADANEEGDAPLFDATDCIGYVSKYIQSVSYITIIKDGAGVGRVRKLPAGTAFIGTMGALFCTNSNFNFLFTMLEKFDFSLYTTGSTIPHVYYRDYSECVILVPCLEEQKEIGNYFSKLDNLITLFQRKLQLLKNIKQALLEKMFV